MDKEQLLSVEHHILDKLESLSQDVTGLRTTPLHLVEDVLERLSQNLEDALALVTSGFAELKDGVN